MKSISRITRLFRPRWLASAQNTADSLGRGSRALLLFFSALLLISTLGLLYTLRQSYIQVTPAYGGSITEGIIGSPRFINPVLALSDADQDLTSLVFSGLLRATPSGEYVPDLAQSYEISEDGKTYTFVLKENLTFHDGTPLTSSDVAFTMQKAQDPALKSPLRANWDGVRIEIPDETTIRFTLKAAYAPFIENLTLGILPKARWMDISDEEFPFSELNAEPIGSGPYAVSVVSHNSSGIPSVYSLRAFKQYALGEPYLTRITLRFYQSESALLAALTRGEVQSASSISPSNLRNLSEERIRTSPLNRVFGVFFNQNQSSVLRDKDVREALSTAIDRKVFVETILGGYGTPLTSPVPPTLIEGETPEIPAGSPATAREALTAAGWSTGEDGILSKGSQRLTFTLATANVPELRAAAEYLREEWNEAGAEVRVEIFEQGDLSQNIIRPRKYDALLFGQVIGRELDLFAFWHSSQRNDPGLNIAGYANSTVDQALEAMRSSADPARRQSLLNTFLNEFEKDLPAVFLYAPDFVYSVPNDIAGIDLGFIETPKDRFLSVTEWHRETDEVWPVFVRNY